MPKTENALQHDRFTGEYSFRLTADKEDLLARLSRIEKLCACLNREARELSDALTAEQTENHRPGGEI